MAAPPPSVSSPRLAFVASTGRTATMFLAAALDGLPRVTALHEGHDHADPPVPRLPLVNLQNGPAWHDPHVADQTVQERRDRPTLAAAAGPADLIVDVAFYNAPLLGALAFRHPSAHLIAIFRRCESFVRSATVLAGEDRQPAGWPAPGKELTDRERFVALGRLRPAPCSTEAELWPRWSAIQRNTWLWHTVNRHLATAIEQLGAVPLFFEHLAADPTRFWATCLSALGIDDPTLLAACVTRSDEPINARPGYQVGPAGSWSPAERELYERLALPLEVELYG